MARSNGARIFVSSLITSALTVSMVGVLPAHPAAGDEQGPPSTTLIRSSWGYVDQNTPRRGYLNPAGDAPVGAWRDHRGHHAARSYFGFDVARFRGKRIVAATLSARETHANDCGHRAIELWATGPFTARSSWNHPPAQRSRLATSGLPASGCLVENAEFDVAEAVRGALQANETAITLELRVPADREGATRFGRLFANDLTLKIVYNTPPDTPVDLRIGPNLLPCPPQSPGVFFNPELHTNVLAMRAKITDADQDELTARFALWPADDPSQRRELDGPVTESQAYAQVDGHTVADATTYAWNVQGNDGTDTSPLSDTCYVTIDKIRPEFPTVTSTVYPPWFEEGGGPGVPGPFTFTANGSTDVTGYEYRFTPGGEDWTFVEADQLGGSATISFTPTDSGYHYVAVRSVDRAQNRSWENSYSFAVRETRPFVFSQMYPPEYPNPAGGIGVPGTFDFSSNLPNTVQYTYHLDDGPDSTVAAGADGRASVTLTPTRGGQHVLYVYSTDSGGQSSPVREYGFLVDTAPVVTGADRGFTIGSPAEFTFAPRMSNVTEYDYWFVDSQQRPTPTTTVPAGPDGTAAVTWTPVTSEVRWLKVRSRTADGTLSVIRTKYISTDGARPEVTRQGANAPGEAGTFTFRTRMATATEFVYWFNGDRSTTATVPAEPDHTAIVTWTPPRGGSLRVDVQARNAAGVLSDEGSIGWFVDDSPVVSSQEFLMGNLVRPGPGTFTFAARLPNPIAYEYSFDNDPYVTVPAEPAGTASLNWTPPRPDWTYRLQVRSRHADGTASLSSYHLFTVFDGPEVSSTDYPYGEWRGGPGIAGTFVFSPGVPGVTEYVYRLRYEYNEPGPETTVAADPDDKARVTWTPDRSGQYTLSVQSRTADATLSGTWWHTFYVAYPSSS